MTSPSLTLKSAQVAYFARLNLADKLSVAARLQTALAKLLDGEPLVLPALPDSPPEIPQIVLRSQPGTYQCVVTPVRVDLTYIRPAQDAADAPPHSIQDVLERGAPLLSLIRDDLSTRVTRLGLLAQFEVELLEDASSFVRQHFLASNAPSGSRAIELSILDRIELGSLPANRWIRIKTKPDEASLLTLVADLNTPADEELHVNDDQAAQFFRAAANFLHDDLPLAAHLA